jgi:hypothetical protein
MGISSGVYLGNEITWENIWDAMKKKVDEAKDASNKGDTKTSNALKKEIQKLLKSIYSAT